MSTCTSATLPVDQASKESRASLDAQESGSTATSRKGKDREDEIREAAINGISRPWKERFEAAAAWTLDHIRQADQRYQLEVDEKALIPLSGKLQKMLLDFFLRPLTWSAIEHSSMLVQLQPADVELDEDKAESEVEGNVAQFYIRRLKCEDHKTLRDLLQQVKAVSPQYTGQIEGILDESSKVTGERWLSQGAFTVAKAPSGRVVGWGGEDWQESMKIWSFPQAVLEAYKGVVEVYEVPILRFKVGDGGTHSIIESRVDSRTGLFESLVDDSHGFVCLNNAPSACTFRERVYTAEDFAQDEAIQNLTFPPEAFSFLL